MTQVAPSLLSADFSRLAQAVEMLNGSNASMIHIDVMDGVFVPNITVGFPVIASLARVAVKPMDVHMMTVDPGRWVGAVRDAGAALMNVHYEACTHLHRVVASIHEAGMKAGVTVNPATPVELLRDIIADVDLALVMSVNPGFGGQRFITNSVDKVRRLRRLIEQNGSHALIQVDGGVNLTTAPALIEAGADVLVAGNYVFGAPDPRAAIDALAECR